MGLAILTAFFTVLLKVLADVIAKHWETWIVWFASPMRWLSRVFNAFADWCEKRGLLSVTRLNGTV